MTQVKEWTDNKLNRELTKLLGYKVIKVPNADKYRMVNPHGKEFGMTWSTEGLVWNDYAFPFCTDHAASLEVQTAAIKADPRKYGINLAKLLKLEEDDLEYSENDVFSYTGVTIFLLASPRERAEAAYQTLQEVRE
ncbi:hypothetical protein D3C75_610190 [compost metagenome]